MSYQPGDAPTAATSAPSCSRRRPAAVGRIEKARDPRRALVRPAAYLAPFKAALARRAGPASWSTPLLGLAGPYLMGVAIDRFIAVEAGWTAWHGSPCSMLAVYVLNNLFQAVANWIMAGVSQTRPEATCASDLFGHLQTLPLRLLRPQPGRRADEPPDQRHRRHQPGRLAERHLAVASVLSMVGILIAMFVLNHWLALASLLVVPIMLWFTQFVARYTRKGFRDLQKHLGELNGVMEESISGQQGGQGLPPQRVVPSRLPPSTTRRSTSAGVYANTYALLLMPLTNVLGNFFVIVLAGLGGWLALRGLVTVGIIATFISYGQNFINPLRQLANMYNSIQAALAGAERVFEIIDTPSGVDDAPDAAPPARCRAMCASSTSISATCPARPSSRT